MMTSQIQTELSGCVLCWLATVGRDGRPNVSPKEVFAPLDETRLAIADIASAGSVRNLRANPAACVSVIDIFTQKGWRLDGAARVIAPDDESFDACAAPLRARAGEKFCIRHVLVIEVQRVTRVRAPSYQLIPGTTEAEMRRAARIRYGVRPEP